jgi:hypothetical protein
MPLLARSVKNVLVFFNTNTREFTANDDLKSLFMPVGIPDGGGDKTHNQVFDSGEYEVLRQGYSTAAAAGRPLVHCRTGLTVRPNAFYNIAGYDGLNVCIFYNADASSWHDAITDKDVHALFEGAASKKSALENFPWYDTFEQNKPSVIYLDPQQVNSCRISRAGSSRGRTPPTRCAAP